MGTDDPSKLGLAEKNKNLASWLAELLFYPAPSVQYSIFCSKKFISVTPVFPLLSMKNNMIEKFKTPLTGQQWNINAYLSVIRPDHWLKNVFILFGHGAAFVLLGMHLSWHVTWLVVLSLLPACFVASANYVLNEILDAPFDRLHPTKKARAVACGDAKEGVLWVLMGLLLVGGFVLAWPLFNVAYLVSLLLLFLSGLVYNVPPLRLKDRAFMDVIAESFNNPIRLWLGWYAIAPQNSFPPLSIIMAWWMFGALLMTGKRYAEYRFINSPERSGAYRRSFKTYTEKSLLIAMITYANLFCFCAGTAVAVYRPTLCLRSRRWWQRSLRILIRRSPHRGPAWSRSNCSKALCSFFALCLRWPSRFS
jgi:4-hydroxybenzoate polyprenyltransferase